MHINKQATTVAATTFAFMVKSVRKNCQYDVHFSHGRSYCLTTTLSSYNKHSIPQAESKISVRSLSENEVIYGKADKAPSVSSSFVSVTVAGSDASLNSGVGAAEAKVDAGILLSAGAEEAGDVMTISAVAPTCAEGFLDCFNGKVRGTSTPCSTSCAGKCCVGTNACSSFTGKVCKDGSCSGTKACFYANIPHVVKSCKALEACNSAGYDGTVGNIVNSCNFEKSCAYAGEEGGKAGDIDNSCGAKRACYSVGTQSSGGVGKIINSCNAYTACRTAGAGYVTAGLITSDLVNCCNTQNACKNAKESTLPAQCPCPTKVRGIIVS